MRASIWSDPDDQIEFEVLHHPQSARSLYELGRVRLERGAADGDLFLRQSGVEAMERAAELAPIPTLALTALISSGVDDGDGARIERVLAALRKEDRDVVRIGLFRHFVKCQAYGRCTPAPDVVRDLTDAILEGCDLAVILTAVNGWRAPAGPRMARDLLHTSARGCTGRARNTRRTRLENDGLLLHPRAFRGGFVRGGQNTRSGTTRAAGEE